MEFAINLNQADSIASGLKRENQKLRTYYSAILSVANSCPLSGNAKAQMVQTLKKIAAGIDSERETMSSMYTTLNASVQTYKKCEQKLAKTDSGASVNWGNSAGTSQAGGSFGGRDSSGETGSTQSGEATQSSIEWDWYKNVVSQFAAVGNVVSVIGNIVSGNNDTKGVIDTIGYAVSAVGEIAASVYSSQTSWCELIGWTDGLAGLDTTSFNGTFLSSLNKQFDIGAKTTADKIEAATKWSGYILTVVSNGYQNYDEMNRTGISAGRAVAETVVESVVDIGADAIAVAGISAIAAAAGVAAPAVAIGIGATLVVWFADSMCKELTDGKDMGEFVADGICDFAASGFSTLWSGSCSVFA